MNMEPNTQPVPEIFCRQESKTPFGQCTLCESSLSEQHYIVEKVIRNYQALNTSEVIFEYAMCLNCAQSMHMALSEESRKKVEAYLSAHVDREARNREAACRIEKPAEQWISKCLVKDQQVNQAAGYSIYALCKGNEIIYGDLPYAICEEAQEEIVQLLSAKSLKIMDDFIGQHFSGPPEVAEILKRRPVLF